MKKNQNNNFVIIHISIRYYKINIDDIVEINEKYYTDYIQFNITTKDGKIEQIINYINYNCDKNTLNNCIISLLKKIKHAVSYNINTIIFCDSLKYYKHNSSNK